MEEYLDQVHRSQAQKWSLGVFHRLLRCWSMDPPKKQLRNSTGRNTKRGVFKTSAISFNKCLLYGRQNLIQIAMICVNVIIHMVWADM